MNIKPKNSSSISLVQLTDSHLGADVGERLIGMDTDESLHCVIDLVAKERDSIDLILATGDISNGGSLSSYRRFRDSYHRLCKQCLWLPGNHDNASVMKSAAQYGTEMSGRADIGNWTILMLNTAIDGEVGGNLAAQELEKLSAELQSTTDRHVLICLHHHPVDIGCAWLASQRVSNGDSFFRLLDQYTHVAGVLWGHVHQEYDKIRRGVRLMSTPSTCVQFAANSAEFTLDKQAPGYRWLELLPDGKIESGVSRVVDFKLEFDVKATGY